MVDPGRLTVGDWMDRAGTTPPVLAVCGTITHGQSGLTVGVGFTVGVEAPQSQHDPFAVTANSPPPPSTEG